MRARSGILPVFILPILMIVTACEREREVPPADTAAGVAGTADAGQQQWPTEFNPPSFIGATYPPIPAHLQQMSAAVIPAAPGSAAAADPLDLTEYGLTDIQLQNRRMLWLSKLVSRNEAGEATWRIVDAVEVPAPPPGAAINLACSAGQDPGYAAIVAAGEGSTLAGVQQAWRANLQTEKLEPAQDTQGITCEQLQETGEGAASETV